MANLLILGAGGHGKVVAEAAIATGKWDEIAFLDDRFPTLEQVLNISVVGTIASASTFVNEFDSTIVAIGDAVLRMRFLNDMKELGFYLPVVIHPRASISPSSVLGEGTVVFSCAVVNAAATIGKGCILNTGSIVEHDCSLGCGVHMCPGAKVGGGSSIGRGCWIGLGSSLIHGISIGDQVTVGAGAVVIENIEEVQTVVGVPARKVLK